MKGRGQPLLPQAAPWCAKSRPMRHTIASAAVNFVHVVREIVRVDVIVLALRRSWMLLGSLGLLPRHARLLPVAVPTTGRRARAAADTNGMLAVGSSAPAFEGDEPRRRSG